MEIIKRGDLRLLIADEGKHIRAINDVYKKNYIEEETGELVEEHFPNYSEIIFLANTINDEDISKYYVEEKNKKNVNGTLTWVDE